MKDHIHLLEKPKLVKLKHEVFENLPTEQEKHEYIRKNGLIPIKTMRLENIMFYITVSAEVENISDLQIHFYNKKVGGPSSSHAVYLSNLRFELSNDKKLKRFKILDTGLWGLGGYFEVNFVAFTFGYEIPKNDFEFKFDAFHKWTYRICADGINKEFWFDDGRKHHEIGDNFSYTNKIELTVRDQGHIYPYLLCSATGRF